MPVITFASSKGGAGKTTSAIILGTSLAKERNVVLIDADPAKRLMSWARKMPVHPRLEVVESQGESSINNEINRARERAKYVIVDTESDFSRLTVNAVGESNLVIIPMADEQPDEEGAIETLKQLALMEKAGGREISAEILFTRTSSGKKSWLEQSINGAMRQQNNCLKVELCKLDAFAALQAFGGTLGQLDRDKIEDVSKAIANAEALAKEIMDGFFRSDPVRQMSLRMKDSTYGRFRQHCKDERRTNGKMLEVMMLAYEEKLEASRSE